MAGSGKLRTLDDIRAKYPHLSLALYAYDPGGPVTLELLSADGTWRQQFNAASEELAVAAAFADEDDDAPGTEIPASAPEPPTTNVFD